MIYESLASKQAPLNLAQIARWFGTQDEPVRKFLEMGEPFTWLKHLDKGTFKSSRSSRYLSALMIEEYVHAQKPWDRIQTISKDSSILESESRGPRGSRSPPLLSPSRTGLSNVLGSSKSTNPTSAGVSFEPKATRTIPIDTASRKSADSGLSSVVTGSSILGTVPLSPVSTRLNQFVEKSVGGHKIFDDTSSSDGSEASDDDDGRPQPLASVPDVSLQPPSSEDVATRHSPIPLRLGVANSTGSLESTNPHPVRVVPSENQSLSSIKSSSKPRRIRMSLHASRPTRRGTLRADSEESLRLEYEAKAMYVSLIISENLFLIFG